jgi:MFS family permease
MMRNPEIFRNRDFRVLLFTRLLGAMALQAQDMIAGWQIYSLTHSTFMLGLTGLVEAVPALLCALVAGHIVDTGRPWRILLAAVGLLSLNTLMLCLVAGGTIRAPGGAVAWIFAGIFISGLARSFIMPGAFTLLSQIVPRKQMPGANAWFTGSFHFATVTAPAAAGLVYGRFGVRGAWLLPVSLMLCALLLLPAMSTGPRRYKNSATREPVVQSIKTGWRFILTNRTLLSVMSLDMFAVLFGGAVAMLPAYADQVLHVGSEGLGILRAASAVGAGFTALFLAIRPLNVMRGATLLRVVAGFGLAIIGFGVSHVFWLSFLMLALSGAFDSVSMIIRSTLMQLLTPDAMRGRVSAVGSMFIVSSNEIGAFESGTAATLLGLIPSVVFGGICTLAVVAATALLSPKLRRTAVTAEELEK